MSVTDDLFGTSQRIAHGGMHLTAVVAMPFLAAALEEVADMPSLGEVAVSFLTAVNEKEEGAKNPTTV